MGCPQKWIANNLIHNRNSDFTFAFYAIKRLCARLRDADSGHNVNKLLLYAVWTGNRYRGMRRFRLMRHKEDFTTALPTPDRF
jgi:hypothetical protein